MKLKFKSILYVNYSPYENAGYILDYLLKNFKVVYLFSIGFHDLGENRGKNRLIIYKNGKKIFEKKYFHLRISKKLEYLFVPIRSTLNLFQIILVASYIYKKYGKIEKYLSVNAFTAWTGLVLRGFGFLDRTIFWVWDYYPLVHKNVLILLMRWIYWQFDRISMYSDKVVFLNQKLASIYIKKNILSTKSNYSIVPIGTKTIKRVRKIELKNIRLVFLGVLKKSQGLDFILDTLKKIKNKKIKLDVIGGGPDSEYFMTKASNNNLNVKFYGNISDQAVDSIIKRSHIGIATYIPDKSNVSYFGDPSKVKRYLGFGLPVITTDVFDFSKNIDKHKAGFIVKYNDFNRLRLSLRKIMSRYVFYSNNSLDLAKNFKYNIIYKEMFKI